ncbi:MAG: hypothetical protein Q9227_008426 [Pyrenula ochraceoflavens]
MRVHGAREHTPPDCDGSSASISAAPEPDDPPNGGYATSHDAPSRSPPTVTPIIPPQSTQTPSVRFSTESNQRHTNDGARSRSGLSLDESRNLPPASDATTGVLEEQLTTSPDGIDSHKFSPGPSSLPARRRGYSLRRSILARSARQSSGSMIEMTESPSAESLRYNVNGDKPKERANVVVSPELKGSDLDLPSQVTYNQDRSMVSHGTKAISPLKLLQNAFSQRFFEIYERSRKTILRIQDIPPSEDGRRINLDTTPSATRPDERTGQPYISNLVRSSRYTLVNFFPRQLFAQFSKLANAYFLTISILQMIPGLSTTGTYTTIVPLLAFVSLSMAKEGYDDLRRYRLDKEENRRKCQVLEANIWVEKLWQNLSVGDVIKVDRNQPIPADIALLNVQTSESIAYVETMALDGETSLKSKAPSPPLVKRCQNDSSIQMGAFFIVEDPNPDLYKFEGKVEVDGETLPLTNNEIIYRGSILRNTPAVRGLVIYTGEECKIRMNANKNPRIKAPTLQFHVNRVVIIVVSFVITLAVFMTVAYQIWRKGAEAESWYLTSARVSAGPNFTSYIIMVRSSMYRALY